VTPKSLSALALRNPRIEYDFYFSGLEEEFIFNVNNEQIVLIPIL
jgi:hypothetical protein